MRSIVKWSSDVTYVGYESIPPNIQAINYCQMSFNLVLFLDLSMILLFCLFTFLAPFRASLRKFIIDFMNTFCFCLQLLILQIFKFLFITEI